jgi:hypothetical protein
VARAAFAELVERHPGQAFAHYFLGECERMLGRAPWDSLLHFRDIVSRDPIWLAAAERFGLNDAQFFGHDFPHYANRVSGPGLEASNFA